MGTLWIADNDPLDAEALRQVYATKVADIENEEEDNAEQTQVAGIHKKTELKNPFETELNYRTRPLSGQQEVRLTLLVAFLPIPVVLILGRTFSWLLSLHITAKVLIVAALMLLTLQVALKRLLGQPYHWNAVFGIAIALGTAMAFLWHMISQLGQAILPLAIVASWFASCLVARQISSWILASPRVDGHTVSLWSDSVPSFKWWRRSMVCPELVTYQASPLLLGISACAADRLTRETLGLATAFPAMLFSVWFLLLSACYVLRLMPKPDPLLSLRMSWQALIVFCTYDVHQSPAAGIFRFPTRWLRSIACRWVLMGSVLILLSLGLWGRFDTWNNAAAVMHPLASWTLMKLAVATVSAPLTFLCILWGAAGSVLARFHRSLEESTDKTISDWDNYAARLINSGNPLEREHFFLGASLVGDYPVLLHREILNQHYHMLGDTGSSKTSLGICPLVTQLIARGDCSVVVLDLKGDKALFETCRIEAARSKSVLFRWICTEIGKTTFAFNPLMQKHLGGLSQEQVAQEILQGLALDYGVDYGRGFYSAMNEIVLLNLLRHYRIRSFRDLRKYIDDPDAYAAIGEIRDWREARHLGVLANRLAETPAINVFPDTFADRPDVLEQAIDVQEILETPQVVYGWLPSPQEPIGAPTIARLVMWSLFTAAAHRPHRKNHVYLIIDEFQQVIADALKLVFEQIRGLGVTIVAAHQTEGQLKRAEIDLRPTVESCTAVKQVYRASDLDSIKRLQEVSGKRPELMQSWVQPWETGAGDLTQRFRAEYSEEGLVKVSEQEQPVLKHQRLLSISSNRFASLVRFTFGSGYTQFAGGVVPIVSQYPISLKEYKRRWKLPWPSAPGTFKVPAPRRNVLVPTSPVKVPRGKKFGDFDWQKRLKKVRPS